MKYSSLPDLHVFFIFAGRHFKDPAIAIELAVGDDRSEIDMTYSIGKHPGESDVHEAFNLRGPSIIVERVCITSRGQSAFIFA